MNNNGNIPQAIITGEDKGTFTNKILKVNFFMPFEA